jgi:hypothetical protein
MLNQEQIDKVVNAIKHCDLYYVDRNDDLSHLSSDEWLSLIRTWYLEQDITENWEVDFTWIMDIAYEALDNPDRDDDDLRYEIQDLIYEHCSNDAMKDLLRNTRHQNIIHVIGDLDDVELPKEVEDSEEYGEYDLYAFRTGMMLGRSLEDMLQMYQDYEDWKECEWRKYYSIYNEGFGYTKLCVAYKMDADDIPNIHKAFSNGDKVKLRNWDVGVINNSEGSGWMDTNRFLIDPVFIFDINQCYHDKSMGRYGYYDQVCWDDADHGQIVAIERIAVPLVTTDPLAAMRVIEAEYEATYKNWGCTFGDTKYDRHRNTKYINEYPCGTHCMTCWQFWID